MEYGASSVQIAEGSSAIPQKRQYFPQPRIVAVSSNRTQAWKKPKSILDDEEFQEDFICLLNSIITALKGEDPDTTYISTKYDHVETMLAAIDAGCKWDSSKGSRFSITREEVMKIYYNNPYVEDCIYLERIVGDAVLLMMGKVPRSFELKVIKKELAISEEDVESIYQEIINLPDFDKYIGEDMKRSIIYEVLNFLRIDSESIFETHINEDSEEQLQLYIYIVGNIANIRLGELESSEFNSPEYGNDLERVYYDVISYPEVQIYVFPDIPDILGVFDRVSKEYEGTYEDIYGELSSVYESYMRSINNSIYNMIYLRYISRISDVIFDIDISDRDIDYYGSKLLPFVRREFGKIKAENVKLSWNESSSPLFAEIINHIDWEYCIYLDVIFNCTSLESAKSCFDNMKPQDLNGLVISVYFKSEIIGEDDRIKDMIINFMEEHRAKMHAGFLYNGVLIHDLSPN